MIWEDQKESVIGMPPTFSFLGEIQKLQWDLSPSIEKSINESEEKFRNVAKSLQFKVHLELFCHTFGIDMTCFLCQIYFYEKYGKNQLKKYQISPDAVAQLCKFLDL